MTHPNKLQLRPSAELWAGLGGADPFPGYRRESVRYADRLAAMEEFGPFFAEAPNLALGEGFDEGGIVSLSGGSHHDGEVAVGIDATALDGSSIAGMLRLGRGMKPALARKVVEALVPANATRAELEAIGFEFVDV